MLMLQGVDSIVWILIFCVCVFGESRSFSVTSTNVKLSYILVTFFTIFMCYTQKLRTIFQTNPSLVWKEKNDFARRRFQTKFRLVWKILMTNVNVVKIPNQIQFGLEQSLTEYSVLNCLVADRDTPSAGKPCTAKRAQSTLPSSQSSTARWADRDTPFTGHPYTT